jgi:hypothetical protein
MERRICTIMMGMNLGIHSEFIESTDSTSSVQEDSLRCEGMCVVVMGICYEEP